MLIRLFLSLSCLLVYRNVIAETPAERLYLLGYQIPAEARADVIAEDRATLQAYAAQEHSWFHPESQETPTFRREQYDKYALDGLCKIDILDCLPDLRKNPLPYQQAIAQLASVYADLEQLQKAEPSEISSIFPKDIQRIDVEPLPSYPYLLRPLLTRHALLLTQAPEQSAAPICEGIAFAKKLINSRQNLIQSLIGDALLRHELNLLSEWRTQTAQTLPMECKQALEPLPIESVDFCPLMQSEAQYTVNYLQSLKNLPLFYHQEKTIANIHLNYAPYCSAQWRATIVADNPAQTPAIVTAKARSSENAKNCALNSIGCLLSNVSVSTLENDTQYQHRLQDANARLRLWQFAQTHTCDNKAFLPTDWAAARELQTNGEYWQIRAYHSRFGEYLRAPCFK
ncbi:hypothetical protein [Suttonella ornithocola]|uniref:Uncharacterized protein n=1 Tax=Suttonella ornithocola TaxID=279832 RepID=A0A380MQT9_9GAMM|nr:hypothetical protein [Suttonella ornithocola]SUO94293.1 Uncharacterised protein [Suttonella ornithocola]